MTAPNPLHGKSEISWGTPAELHLCDLEQSIAWYYRDDDGALVLLDGTHDLITDYPYDRAPNDSVCLEIHNATREVVILTVSALRDAEVSPSASQTLEPGKHCTWECRPGNGEQCPCGGVSGTCACSKWHIGGTSGLGSRPIPDPTFKVRWQGHGSPP